MSLTQVLPDSVNTSIDFTFTGNVIISGAGAVVVGGDTPLIFANGYPVLFSEIANAAIHFADVANAAYIAQSITDGASINVSNITISGFISANSSTGTDGQVLTSNGSVVYWDDVARYPSGGLYNQVLSSNGSGGVFWSDKLNFPVANSDGQILISASNSFIWHAAYVISNTAPSFPNYGDIWYYTNDDRLYMWVNDGSSSYWLDFLPIAG